MKKLEEIEKAKDQVEQDGYNMGGVETEEAFRSEVTGVCRVYFLQVWNEALNQAKVEASSTLKRAKNVYYLLAIQPSGPSSSQDDTTPIVASPTKKALSKDPPPPPPSPANLRKGGSRPRSKKSPPRQQSPWTHPRTLPRMG